ncbi:TPA: dethiobiotin synthase, partial [Burkholderia cenocepacia]
PAAPESAAAMLDIAALVESLRAARP